MRLPKGSVFCLIVLALLALSDAQDSEDSTIPKRVLKKYRVRRPVVLDDQGNVVRAGARLRRVKVKNPRTSTTTGASIGETTTPISVSTSTSVSSSSSEPQFFRQRTIAASPNALQERKVQSVAYEGEGIVSEPIRTVPTFRQATSIENRDALLAKAHYKPSRGTGNAADEEKRVGTTTNYSKINDDGSFTFGYEAEDGSFKEETRGTDCVVRGKYGYIDPEGIRREFEYVSGNPCDPNAPQEEQAEEEEEDSLAPSKPILRQRVAARPSELSGNNIQQGQQQTLEERLPEEQLANFIRPQQRQRTRPVVVRQRGRVTTPSPSEDERDQPTLIVRQRQPFPSFQSARPTLLQEPNQSLEQNDVSRGLFSFDDEVHRLSALSRPQNQPQPLYEQPFRQVVHQPSPAARQIFGNAAFHREQQAQTTAATPSQNGNNNPTFGRYRTELVYDQNSGQYTSVLVQSNPNDNQEFELTQKLRAFASPSPSPLPSPSPSAFPSPTYNSPTGSGAFTQIQHFGQPKIQYYHEPAAPQGRSVNSQQDPGQINQFLARHAYQPQPQQTTQSQGSVNNLQFIPPHLRPVSGQTTEIQRQEVREISIPRRQDGGQIDAFLRALNIEI